MIRLTITFICSLFAFLAISQTTDLPAVLTEVSAVVEVEDQLYWMNDSQHPFTWYVTDKQGKLQDSILFENLENVDVEDMTRDDRGHIFVGDIGNNRNDRRDLKIHKFTLEGEHLGAIQFNYPNQQLFPPASTARFYNAEAIAYYDSNIHLFTKSTPESGFITLHYIIPVLPGNFTARLMESMVLPERVVTAASVSPDGNRLALLGYHFDKILGIFPSSKTSVFVFPLTNKNYFFDQAYEEFEVPSKGATQYEALEWLDNQTLIIGSEKTKSGDQHFRTLKLKTD